MHLEHLQLVFEDFRQSTNAYAIPADGGNFIVFQLVALRPGGRMYLQRACALSADAEASVVFLGHANMLCGNRFLSASKHCLVAQAWQHALGVSVLGSVKSSNARGEAELPALESYECCVEPMTYSFFFARNRWHKLVKFNKD